MFCQNLKGPRQFQPTQFLNVYDVKYLCWTNNPASNSVFKHNTNIYIWFYDRLRGKLEIKYWRILQSFFLWGATAHLEPRPSHSWGFYSRHAHTTPHTQTAHPVWLLWISDQLVAQAATCQHTTNTGDGQPCLQRYSNPAIPAIKRPQTYALDSTAIGIGCYGN